MAKLRRVIRKVPARRGDYFDEKIWPVQIALIVLGAFSMGVSAAYLKFSESPWYENALTYLVLIPLIVAVCMVAFHFIQQQWLRRSMQLSIVLAAIIHVALVVQLKETILKSFFDDDLVTDREVIETRTPKIIQEYRDHQLIPEQDRPKQDFEKPVETKTPEPKPEPEQITRQETKPEQPQAPSQPIPVPESVPTTDPNIVHRQQPNEAAPRQADQTSKLSKQTRPSEMKISELIKTETTEPTKVAGVEAKPTTAKIERQTTETTATAAMQEPTTTTQAATTQLAKKQTQESKIAEASATPTLKKQIATPTETPRSQVAAAEAPPTAKQTDTTALAPANTQSTKKTTASPEIARAMAEPTPEVTAKPDPKPTRRELPAEIAPAIAQNPTSTPTRQPRATTRPDVATTATGAKPQPSTEIAAPSTMEISPQASRVERATTQVTSAKASEIPSTTPSTVSPQESGAKVARAQANENPTAQANPVAMATITRKTGAPSIPSATKIEPAATAPSTSSAAATELAAASTATRRQPTAAPQVSISAGEPAPAQVAATTPTAVTSPNSTRRATSQSNSPSESPSATPSPGTTVATRSTKAGAANVVTTAADVPTNSGPQTAQSGVPRPAASSVSRQTAASSPAASMTQPSLAAQSASSASTVAPAASSARAQASAVPALNPQLAAAGTPSRATMAAPTATSPSSVDSPASAVAASSATSEAAQPSKMALTRATGGTAGVGSSPNIDRATPGGDSPALIASGAARRTQATQEAAPGDALSPSAPAQIARSRAQAAMPSATIQAEAGAVATAPGSQNVTELAASASASISRSDAAAAKGDVTAPKGVADVDLGPTQVVAETGGGRAAGGGQPQMNFETQAAENARRTPAGGAPLMSLAGAKVDASVAAPAGAAGGAPPSIDAAQTNTARTLAGGASVTGGPSAAQENGPLAAASSAQLLAKSEVSRADAADGSSGGASAGQPSVEDEEEKARRLARAAAGGAPELAIGGPIKADIVASPMGAGGDGGAPKVEAAVIATAAARQNLSGGAPAGGAPSASGEPAAAAGAGGASAPGAVAVARAEAAEAAPGAPALGGGTSTPSKAASGPTFAASATAETIQIAGAPASSGSPGGAPIEARGTETGKLAGGAAGPASGGGAVAGDEVAMASSLAPAGAGPGKRQAGPVSDNGPAVGDVTMKGAPFARAANAAPAAGGTTAEVPEVGPTSAVAQAEMDHMMGGMGNMPMTKQSGGDALAVNIEAPEGPGGLGSEFAPEVGMKTRQSRTDSVQVQSATARFVKQAAGGLPSLSTAAIIASEPFMRRSSRAPGNTPGGGKGVSGPETEAAIEMGLVFLARHQLPEGNWSLQGFDETTNAVSAEERRFMLISDTGATALSILSFQGGGYTHREHQYKEVVRKGLEYLVRNQKENGDLFVPLDDRSNQSVWLYSHALATIALCEAYGMTGDPALKDPAQKAINFIVTAQNKDLGGWRYAPGVGTDTSVTGWMMMALKSGELANLEVPQDSYGKISKWLELSQGGPGEPYVFRYNPYAPDTPQQRHGRVPSKTMTAVGLLMRLYTGWEKTNPNLVNGARYLGQQYPQIGTAANPQRDTYYWYYATQVMCHMEGEHWENWKRQLFPLLRDSQVKNGAWAGSWNPRGAVPDRWGLHAGRLYVTTMNLLSLEVEYRKLPLYVDLRKEKK
ncbi:MAG: hypothetical protein K8R36_23005 [Planctomycetales bacterium]|nr:hypothetical protein [Planctomycetales bacterium]